MCVAFHIRYLNNTKQKPPFMGACMLQHCAEAKEWPWVSDPAFLFIWGSILFAAMCTRLAGRQAPGNSVFASCPTIAALWGSGDWNSGPQACIESFLTYELPLSSHLVSYSVQSEILPCCYLYVLSTHKAYHCIDCDHLVMPLPVDGDLRDLPLSMKLPQTSKYSFTDRHPCTPSCGEHPGSRMAGLSVQHILTFQEIVKCFFQSDCSIYTPTGNAKWLCYTFAHWHSCQS